MIEDILVFGEDDMVMAEVYPNFKYAEVAGITDIESVVSEIIKSITRIFPHLSGS